MVVGREGREVKQFADLKQRHGRREDAMNEADK